MANPERALVQPLQEPAARAELRRPPLRAILNRGLLYLVLLLGGVIAIFPFFWMITNSLMTLGETINRVWLPAVPQFQNYIDAWNQANFARFFWNSVVITTLTCAGLLVTSVLAGYAFARIHFVGRELIFALLLATLMIPESVTVIPSFLLVRGAIIPLPGGSWLNKLPALTVPFMANAFSIFLLRQFFAQVPNELWDAARMDGAGHGIFLTRVVLPISKAPIMTVLIFAFIGAWNAFMWPLLVTTTEIWRPLMVGLWNFMGEAGPQTNLLMAGAVITIIPILILYFVAQKQFTEGIATTGLKG